MNLDSVRFLSHSLFHILGNLPQLCKQGHFFLSSEKAEFLPLIMLESYTLIHTLNLDYLLLNPSLTSSTFSPWSCFMDFAPLLLRNSLQNLIFSASRAYKHLGLDNRACGAKTLDQRRLVCSLESSFPVEKSSNGYLGRILSSTSGFRP